MLVADICNTLADINSELKDYATNFDTYPFDLPENFFTSPAGLRIFRDAKPMEGVARAIKLLSSVMGGITYVTTRPRETEFITKRWLQKHSFPAGEIIFCDRSEKPKVYAELKPTIVVEDDPEVLEKIKDSGVLILMPQWEYNQHIICNRLIPVKDVSAWR